MMNVGDYIIDFLLKKGVDTIFMVPGGHAMFLNDAVARNKKIKPIFTHHEQAAAMAAEAYGRISGKLGVALITAGPGGINALNGVVGGWVDSAPMMIISGQSHLPIVQYMEKTKIRQYGVQGINIRSFVQAGTKYFITVDDPTKIAYYMDKAFFEATTGRTGPVWIDVPLDIQKSVVPMKLQKIFEFPEEKNDQVLLKKQVTETLAMLYQSKRPVILAGQGIRIAHAAETFLKVLEKTNTPVISTRLGLDLIETSSKLFIGRPGLYGDRPANLAVQNADLIISIGSRLDTGCTGYDQKDWGRNGKKVVVDIDKEELDKPGVAIDLKINADAKKFLEELLKQVKSTKIPSRDEWIKTYQSWRKKYPMNLPEYKKEKLVNSYHLTDRVSALSAPNDVIVVDTSSPFHVVCQTWKIKKGQRMITTGGISTMGYWPAAIGACMARGRKRTIVMVGDGSLQMNLQELATVKHNNLPLKIFVIDNNGYLLIRHTQKTHLEKRYMGESPKTGLWCPDVMKLAKAYGIKAIQIDSVKGMDQKIKRALATKGPVIINVKSPEWQMIIPRIASDKMPDGTLVAKPYEDLFPFLSKEEMATNMVAAQKKV